MRIGMSILVRSLLLLLVDIYCINSTPCCFMGCSKIRSPRLLWLCFYDARISVAPTAAGAAPSDNGTGLPFISHTIRFDASPYMLAC